MSNSQTRFFPTCESRRWSGRSRWGRDITVEFWKSIHWDLSRDFWRRITFEVLETGEYWGLFHGFQCWEGGCSGPRYRYWWVSTNCSKMMVVDWFIGTMLVGTRLWEMSREPWSPFNPSRINRHSLVNRVSEITRTRRMSPMFQDYWTIQVVRRHLSPKTRANDQRELITTSRKSTPTSHSSLADHQRCTRRKECYRWPRGCFDSKDRQQASSWSCQVSHIRIGIWQCWHISGAFSPSIGISTIVLVTIGSAMVSLLWWRGLEEMRFNQGDASVPEQRAGGRDGIDSSNDCRMIYGDHMYLRCEVGWKVNVAIGN
jgi:hypothetical protein